MLKEIREKRGLTQAQLAKALGYTSPQFISNWERGICQPPPEKFPKIAKLLKISVNTLIDLRLKQTEKKLRKAFKLKH